MVTNPDVNEPPSFGANHLIKVLVFAPEHGASLAKHKVAAEAWFAPPIAVMARASSKRAGSLMHFIVSP
jgi:hypothetical protein